jgi:hypothetical protein
MMRMRMPLRYRITLCYIAVVVTLILIAELLRMVQK